MAVASSRRNPSPSAASRDSGLSLNLSSNNPFRNRISPLPSPSAHDPPQHRMSRNPFLASNELSASDNSAPPKPRDEVNGMAADIFSDLSLVDKPTSNGTAPRAAPPRPGNLPAKPPPPYQASSPAKREPRPSRPRRASESSTMDRERRDRHDRDRSERPPRTESEERRRRERRKAREERHKREKESGGKKNRPQKGLDLIDKLDLTGIYGQGTIHHDGPFDACNPHRNVKKDRRAPMQAFPTDSMNMAMGGSGPVQAGLDLDKFHGRGEEGFQDFSATRKQNEPTVINPTDRIEQVHGAESYGLGTSTFLDGAPASKSALMRRDTDDGAAQDGAGGGLGRKKSIVQRFRGMSNPRSRNAPAVVSPEARYRAIEDERAAGGEKPQIKSLSGGGHARAAYTQETEINPFDNEYDEAFDKKGAQIRITEQEKPYAGRARAPSSPGKPPPYSGNGLTRTRTEDSVDREEGPSGSGGGFLNRMKSLKGGKRPRPERGISNN